MYGRPKSIKCGRFVLFMPFLLVVRVECHTFVLVFCNMLIINAYFDSCNMDVTSGANVLIVNDS